jgi:hypothetical protein
MKHPEVDAGLFYELTNSQTRAALFTDDLFGSLKHESVGVSWIA